MGYSVEKESFPFKPKKIQFENLVDYYLKKGISISDENPPIAPIIDQEELVAQASSFFFLGCPSTYGKMPIYTAGMLVDNFHKLSEGARNVPYVKAGLTEEEMMRLEYLGSIVHKEKINDNDQPALEMMDIQYSANYQERESTIDFLKTSDLWDESLNEGKEAQALFDIVRSGGPIQKFALYTGYFYLLAKECANLPRSQVDLYSTIFEHGIKQMQLDPVFKGKVLFPFQEDSLEFTSFHPKEIFLQEVNVIRQTPKLLTS